MNQTYLLANSITWAAAIIASALLGAPSTVTLVLLPVLATASWLIALPKSSVRVCRR
jgi:hypothetical protein